MLNELKAQEVNLDAEAEFVEHCGSASAKENASSVSVCVEGPSQQITNMS